MVCILWLVFYFGETVAGETVVQVKLTTKDPAPPPPSLIFSVGMSSNSNDRICVRV